MIKELAEQAVEVLATKTAYNRVVSELGEVSRHLADHDIEKLIINLGLSDAQKISKIDELLADISKDLHADSLNIIAEIKTSGMLVLLSPENMALLIEEIEAGVSALKRVKITFATELKYSDIQEVKAKLEKILKFNLILEVNYKPNLIAGFILQYDSIIIDSSIENALEEYRHNWVKTLNSKFL